MSCLKLVPETLSTEWNTQLSCSSQISARVESSRSIDRVPASTPHRLVLYKLHNERSLWPRLLREASVGTCKRGRRGLDFCSLGASQPNQTLRRGGLIRSACMQEAPASLPGGVAVVVAGVESSGREKAPGMVARSTQPLRRILRVHSVSYIVLTASIYPSPEPQRLPLSEPRHFSLSEPQHMSLSEPRPKSPLKVDAPCANPPPPKTCRKCAPPWQSGAASRAKEEVAAAAAAAEESPVLGCSSRRT